MTRKQNAAVTGEKAVVAVRGPGKTPLAKYALQYEGKLAIRVLGNFNVIH